MSAADLKLAVGRSEDEDRFARFRLIAWWDVELLANTNVLVIGAGALGNELLKNLALLGVGNVLVCDMDHIEMSNLSRSVLYRPSDEGKPKALTAARRTSEIFAGCTAEAFMGNVCTTLGLGAFKWADVVLGGLDNREARLYANRSCLRVGTPWVDGAIEALQGVVRAFGPGEDPCYECTLSETDWKLLDARKACTLLTRHEMEGGKTPTTPTTSAVIAGLQCQEALKIVHKLDGVLYGQGYVFEGLFHQSYTVKYTRNPDCQSHSTLAEIRQTGLGVEDATLGELLDLGAEALRQAGHEVDPAEVVLDFGRDVIHALRCAKCEEETEELSPLGGLSEDDARCPTCEEVRAPLLLNHVTAGSSLLERTAGEVGLPPWDILVARHGTHEVGIELDGDRSAVLGRIEPSPSAEGAALAPGQVDE